MEILWKRHSFGIVSDKLPETMLKLCIFHKISTPENYVKLRSFTHSVIFKLKRVIKVKLDTFLEFSTCFPFCFCHFLCSRSDGHFPIPCRFFSHLLIGGLSKMETFWKVATFSKIYFYGLNRLDNCVFLKCYLNCVRM